jgi:hypothetical protein
MRVASGSACKVPVYFEDSSNNPATGLTLSEITITRSFLDGSTPTTANPTREIGLGWYVLDESSVTKPAVYVGSHASYKNYPGTLVEISESDTAPTVTEIRTEMDTNSTKLANLDATMSSRLATSGYTAPDNTSITAIKNKTDNLPADPASNTQVNTRLASASYTAPPTAQNNADAVLDTVTEGAWTLRKILRIIMAAFGGKSSGGGTGTEVYRDVGDTKPRITALTDSNGNRSSVTVDGD